MRFSKLLMTWNIIRGQEQAYVAFHAKEFVPGLMAFGLHPVDSWFTMYGEGPQVIVGWVAEDAEVIKQALASDGWATLRDKLEEHVTDFTSRIVPWDRTFQM